MKALPQGGAFTLSGTNLTSVIIASAEQMQALAAQIASKLNIGDVLVLSGPLGAGKTTFTQGLARAIGVESEVTSPTFVIARYHHGPKPLIHVDAYRLRGSGSINPATALDDLDLDSDQAITVMEWGDELGQVLSDSYLTVEIAFIDDNSRDVNVTGHGPRWSGVAL